MVNLHTSEDFKQTEENKGKIGFMKNLFHKNFTYQKFENSMDFKLFR